MLGLITGAGQYTGSCPFMNLADMRIGWHPISLGVTGSGWLRGYLS